MLANLQILDRAEIHLVIFETHSLITFVILARFLRGLARNLETLEDEEERKFE